MSVEIYVRGSDRRTLGLLSSWSKLDLIQRRNQVGTWALTLSSEVEGGDLQSDVDMLEQPGRGVIMRRDGDYLASGWRWPESQVDVTGARAEWVFAGVDDTVHMEDTLCWPAPGSPIGAQPDREFVTALNVPASSRVNQFWVTNAVERLAIPGAAASTTTGLGPQGRSRARFKQLLDLAREICGRNVSFRVIQRDSDRALVPEFWTPEDLLLSVQFSPDTGTVHSWGYRDAGPEITRSIVGAGGEGVDRVFRQRTASQAGLVGSRESDWGNVRRIERFRDARDLSPDDPEIDLELEMDVRAEEDLVEGRRRQAFVMDVSGLPDQRWGRDYRVGDLVRAYAVPGEPIDDLVEQVHVTWDTDGGERTKVWIGPVDDPQERNAKRERDLRKRIRQLETAL